MTGQMIYFFGGLALGAAGGFSLAIFLLIVFSYFTDDDDRNIEP